MENFSKLIEKFWKIIMGPKKVGTLCMSPSLSLASDHTCKNFLQPIIEHFLI